MKNEVKSIGANAWRIRPMTEVGVIRQILGESWDAFQNAPCKDPLTDRAFSRLHAAVAEIASFLDRKFPAPSNDPETPRPITGD